MADKRTTDRRPRGNSSSVDPNDTGGWEDVDSATSNPAETGAPRAVAAAGGGTRLAAFRGEARDEVALDPDAGLGPTADPVDMADYVSNPAPFHEVQHESRGPRIHPSAWKHLESEFKRRGWTLEDLAQARQELDPFSDESYTPATAGLGCPAIPVVVTQSINVSIPLTAPPVPGETWNFSVATGPILNTRRYIQVSMAANWATKQGGNGFGYLGPLNVVSAVSTGGGTGALYPAANDLALNGVLPPVVQPFDPMSSSRLPFATNNSLGVAVALVGCAFEVAETTPVLSRGGKLQHYRSTFAQSELENTYVQDEVIDVIGVQTPSVVPCLSTRLRPPPSLPESVFETDPQASTTLPAEGAYHVCGFHQPHRARSASSNLFYLGDDRRSTALQQTADPMQDDEGAPAYKALYPAVYGATGDGTWDIMGLYLCPTDTTIKHIKGRRPDIPSNLENSGVYLSNLRPEQTFTITARFILNVVPKSPQWMPFAQVPRPVNPELFYFVQTLRHRLPKGVQLDMNDSGGWFRDVVAAFRSMVPALGRAGSAAVAALPMGPQAAFAAGAASATASAYQAIVGEERALERATRRPVKARLKRPTVAPRPPRVQIAALRRSRKGKSAAVTGAKRKR